MLIITSEMDNVQLDTQRKNVYKKSEDTCPVTRLTVSPRYLHVWR